VTETPRTAGSLNSTNGKSSFKKELIKIQKIHCKRSKPNRRRTDITHHTAQQSTAVCCNYISKNTLQPLHANYLMNINNHTAVAVWPKPLTSLSNLYTRNDRK